jgi:Ribbon-helix-helix protein, copG family
MVATKPNRPKRNNCPINVLVRPDQKERLDSEVNRTDVNQSAIVRRALDLLFEHVDKGQLKLGFSELDQGVQR